MVEEDVAIMTRVAPSFLRVGQLELFGRRARKNEHPEAMKELVRKQVFHTREVAASKIFEYLEMFYNPKRRHSYLDYLSPNEFEK